MDDESDANRKRDGYRQVVREIFVVEWSYLLNIIIDILTANSTNRSDIIITLGRTGRLFDELVCQRGKLSFFREYKYN